MFVNMTHMLVCGFQKEDFIVYSYNDKRTLAKIPCSGGGNRKWDFKYGHGEQGSRNASFTFVKDREIFYTYLPMEGYLNVVMKEGLHCRTINCAIEHKTSERNGIDYFTGSEDGTLKWFQWDVANQRILCIQNMQNHLSSVRSVCVVKDVSNRTLVFSGGGRSQLCIYSLDFINDTMELMKEIVLVKTTCKQTEGDVRIMDIAVIDGACQGSDDL
ncbi:WD repeat-containing protein 6, partial [Orchesella cincta]